jgi:predicted metal-dependent peptidase
VRLIAVVDTSGSISADELAAFAAELDALKAQVRADVLVVGDKIAAVGLGLDAPASTERIDASGTK